jgi:hypothetical protein
VDPYFLCNRSRGCCKNSLSYKAPGGAVDVVIPVKPVQNLSQEKLDGGDEREHAVALRRITHLAERGEEGFRLQ